MRIKINFKKNKRHITAPMNTEVNGFINALLGENNEYHGKFSRYSISPMLGRVVDKDTHTFSFPNGGHVFVSSDDPVFMERIVVGLITRGRGMSVMDMEVDTSNMFSSEDFFPNRDYDIIMTTGPVIVKKDGKALTFRDEGFLDVIREKSVKKLIHNGIEEKVAAKMKFELFHLENAHVEIVKLGKQTNIASRVMMIVRGNREARLKLYELGLGVSTGFGFGSVSIQNKQPNY